MLQSGIKSECFIVFFYNEWKTRKDTFLSAGILFLYLRCVLLLLGSYNKAFISPCVHRRLCVCACNKINTSHILYYVCLSIHFFLLLGLGFTVKYWEGEVELCSIMERALPLTLAAVLPLPLPIKLCYLEQVTYCLWALFSYLYKRFHWTTQFLRWLYLLILW